LFIHVGGKKALPGVVSHELQALVLGRTEDLAAFFEHFGAVLLLLISVIALGVEQLLAGGDQVRKLRQLLMVEDTLISKGAPGVKKFFSMRAAAWTRNSKVARSSSLEKQNNNNTKPRLCFSNIKMSYGGAVRRLLCSARKTCFQKQILWKGTS